MSRKELIACSFLCVYHLLYAVLAYRYNLTSPGDAYNYWNLNKSWTEYLNIGTDVIKFINYPFAKILSLPFWFGFLFYSAIGYFAILELLKFSKKYIRSQNTYIKYLLLGIFLLPNLHFWTSVIGKEPIIFLAIVWIVVNFAEGKYNYKLILGSVILILIRPHVALFLLLAIGITYLVQQRKMNLRFVLISSSGVLLCFALYLMTLQLLNRNPFDLPYILKRNDASLMAFKRADSYVPMINYNWLERIFALNFRPLFLDSESLFAFVLSAENFLTLILIIFALLIFIRNRRTFRIDSFIILSICFFLVSSLFFIQRYSCLGIFVRTKIMYMPFILIMIVKIFNVSLQKKIGNG